MTILILFSFPQPSESTCLNPISSQLLITLVSTSHLLLDVSWIYFALQDLSQLCLRMLALTFHQKSSLNSIWPFVYHLKNALLIWISYPCPPPSVLSRPHVDTHRSSLSSQSYRWIRHTYLKGLWSLLLFIISWLVGQFLDPFQSEISLM